MTIIDFRLRPPVGGFLDLRIFSGQHISFVFTRRTGFEPAPSAKQKSIELLFEEMNAVGVTHGVIVGRNSGPLGRMSNQAVADVAKTYPDKFFPVASVDVTERKSAILQIEEARALGMNMLNLEPGALPVPMHLDDRRIYPIYAYCEDNKIPVILMSGGSPGPDISYTEPAHLDRVLADFPDLTVIASHGSWPWVNEVLHIAFRRSNLYVCPDMYLHELPGMEDYIRAANTFLEDRFLFGTAYPLTPVKEYTEWFLKLPLKPAVMDKVLWQNAARLLNVKL